MNGPPLPGDWLKYVEANVPAYHRLSVEDRLTLQRLVAIFLEEKHFEGCGGLELTDEMRVTVAAQACLLALHLEGDLYPGLRTVLIYPGAFIPRRVERHLHGGLEQPAAAALGESWQLGVVVLSWDDVRAGAADAQDGQNVVLHEFAHQLDQEDGVADGVPLLGGRSRYGAWTQLLREHFAAHQLAAESGDPTSLDPYGASSPAEFFAVSTEAFFETPEALSREHPLWYEQLRRFYGQDPAGVGPLAPEHAEPEEPASGGADRPRTPWLRILVTLAALVSLAGGIAWRRDRSIREPQLPAEIPIAQVTPPAPRSCAVRRSDHRVLGQMTGVLESADSVVGYRVLVGQTLFTRSPFVDFRADGVQIVPCRSVYRRQLAPEPGPP